MGNRGLFWLILILLALWLILGAFFFRRTFCGIGGTAAAATAAPAAAATAITKAAPWAAGYSVVNGAATNFKTSDHFRFPFSSKDYVTPIGGVDKKVNETAQYLIKNPNKSLTITGEYKDDEDNKTAFTNLGEARANSLKNLFVSKKVPANQIQLASRKVGTDHFKNNFLLGGATYAISNKVTGKDERLERIKANLVGKPMRIYFNTNAQSVNLTQQQRVDFGDMMYYLDRVSGSKLSIGGHTDNVGDAGNNRRLSRKRAEFVQTYLKGNGVNTGRMAASGFGDTKPIEDNSTDDGRAKNRRVEITLN